MNKNRRILFICDSGIGDLVISLPWIKYYSKLKNCETIICTKKIHSDFLEMVYSDFKFINFSIDKLESLIKENSDIFEVISIRSSDNVLLNLKRLSTIYPNKDFKFNILYERKLSFFYRKLFGNFHYSKVHDIRKENIFKILMNKQDFNPKNYIVPDCKNLFSIKDLSKLFNKLEKDYVVIAGSGKDKQRKFTSEQIQYLSNHIGFQIVLIGRDWEINTKNLQNKLNLIDKTTLKEAISLIFHSKFVFCMDSLFSHISNSYKNVPSLTIMGNAPASRWGPLETQTNSYLLHTNKNGKACRCKACKGIKLEKSCMQQLKIVEQSINVLKKRFPRIFL